jgi:hypothetical protein
MQLRSQSYMQRQVLLETLGIEDGLTTAFLQSRNKCCVGKRFIKHLNVSNFIYRYYN